MRAGCKILQYNLSAKVSQSYLRCSRSQYPSTIGCNTVIYFALIDAGLGEEYYLTGICETIYLSQTKCWEVINYTGLYTILRDIQFQL